LANFIPCFEQSNSNLETHKSDYSWTPTVVDYFHYFTWHKHHPDSNNAHNVSSTHYWQSGVTLLYLNPSSFELVKTYLWMGKNMYRVVGLVDVFRKPSQARGYYAALQYA